MIYGYVRVSTDKQSTENQRFEIENYSKAKGFRIERWVDETISGTTSVSDRQLGRLLKQIRNWVKREMFTLSEERIKHTKPAARWRYSVQRYWIIWYADHLTPSGMPY